MKQNERVIRLSDKDVIIKRYKVRPTGAHACMQISPDSSKPQEALKPQKKAGNMFITELNTIPDSLTIQETLVLLKGAWQKGPYTDFDELVMKVTGCSKEEAERLREKWVDEDELLKYDPEGWLRWI